MIVIDGTPVQGGFRVILEGKDYALPFRMFCYLARLALARKIFVEVFGGWLNKYALSAGASHAESIRRLRNTIPVKILNDRAGKYMLDVEPEDISFNYEMMSQFPDAVIRGELELTK
jgi:hypothetical protein